MALLRCRAGLAGFTGDDGPTTPSLVSGRQRPTSKAADQELTRMKRLLYALCATLVAIGVGGALTLRGQSAGALNNRNGVAVQGYDVVSYFSEGRAVRGQPAFTHEWNGVAWRFATAANRDAFAAAPEKCAPEFGGYCAYGVSRGYAVDVDPEAFAVVDGKLYLNYSKRVQRTWDQDRAGYIEKARAGWPKVQAALNR
jgi:hypothetical protein